jgi:hypothetical protein
MMVESLQSVAGRAPAAEVVLAVRLAPVGQLALAALLVAAAQPALLVTAVQPAPVAVGPRAPVAAQVAQQALAAARARERSRTAA